MNVINKPNAKFRHVYAVVRIDLPVSNETPEDSFSVLKIFPIAHLADKEVARLSKVNSDEGCIYKSFITRIVA
jgi:hypothetical protein